MVNRISRTFHIFHTTTIATPKLSRYGQLKVSTTQKAGNRAFHLYYFFQPVLILSIQPLIVAIWEGSHIFVGEIFMSPTKRGQVLLHSCFTVALMPPSRETTSSRGLFSGAVGLCNADTWKSGSSCPTGPRAKLDYFVHGKQARISSGGSYLIENCFGWRWHSL